MPPSSTDSPKPLCPHCGSARQRVVKSAGRLRLDVIRRRRECLDCHCRWSTSEIIDPASVVEPWGDCVGVTYNPSVGSETK